MNYEKQFSGEVADSLNQNGSRRCLNVNHLEKGPRAAIPASAFLTRLSRYVSLAESERQFIGSVELNSLQKKRGARLVSIGDPYDEIMILQSGWAVMKSYSKAHGNQILRVYLPGEVIGLSEIGEPTATHQICMQTDGAISRCSRKDFHEALIDHPRLGALLTAILSLDLVALRQHFSCMRTMDANRNLKFFLLQLRSRLRVNKVGTGDRFELPLSQVEIGQAIGLTSIYVNKLLRALSAAQEVQIERPYIKLLQRKSWIDDTEYFDAYSEIDTSWFPPAQKSKQLNSFPELQPHFMDA